MPLEDEIKRGTAIGKNDGHNYAWKLCIKCKKGRWVRLGVRATNNTGLCSSCCGALDNRNYKPIRGDRHYKWNGGRVIDHAGYIKIKLYPDDPYYPMVDKQGYVMEHRLIVAKALGRCLCKWEIVHHKGTKYPINSRENRSDNRYPDNLVLMSDEMHKVVNLLEEENKQLKLRIKELEAILGIL